MQDVENGTISQERKIELQVCRAIWSIIFWSYLFNVWLGGVAVGRRIRDQEVASSIPGCSAARCNFGQVVHTLCASVHQAV